MKNKITLVFLAFFMALSIWLSLRIKKTNEQLGQSERNNVALLQEKAMADYRQDILQEAFIINFKLEPEPLLEVIPEAGENRKNLVLLYLKAHACSPCNMPAIKALIHHIGKAENFFILSHPSNRFFLSQLENEPGYIDNVVWVNEKLYASINDSFDAELLFVNKHKLITGRLPLEYLKEEQLFRFIINEFSVK